MLPSSPTFLLSGNLSLSECEPLHRTHDMIPAFLLECVIPNREREIEREGEREREREEEEQEQEQLEQKQEEQEEGDHSAVYKLQIPKAQTITSVLFYLFHKPTLKQRGRGPHKGVNRRRLQPLGTILDARDHR